jgi:HEAT repeat protein
VLPNRFAKSRRFRKASLTGLLLLLLLGPLEAGPLPPLGVDDFRTLIDPKHAPNPEPALAGQILAEYRQKLRQAALDLPSLGEVARVLLMAEWSSAESEFESSVPLDRIRKVVLQKEDDAFKRDVQKLMADYPDDPSSVNQDLVAEIKREVRLHLLERLEDRMRFFLSQGRVVDRIAAANLISDTMNTSRRQDISRWQGVPGVMITTSRDVMPSAHYLRQRLRELSGDLEKLLADPDSLVRVAAIRALSDLGKNPTELVAILKPLLTTQQTDASTRQAAAEGLGRILEVYTGQMDKSRPEPYLKAVEQVLPTAADGLADSNARVRRASLEACQQAALVLDELASDPLARERYPAFRPTLAVVDAVLPKLNACARDRVPELRVGASRVLETFALTVQKMQSYQERTLPPAVPEPSKTSPLDKERGKYKKRTALPLPPSASRGLTPPAAKDQGAYASRSLLIQTAAFDAPQPDELPPPVPVEDAGIQGTVQTMIENLKHPDYRVRLAAVDTLETFGKQAEAAIPALVAALRDTNKFVRWSSARTLGRLSPRRADEVVPGLMRLLDDREDPSVRIAALKALELYGEHAKKAAPLLARIINRGDKEYIMAVLTTIQGIGTDAVLALPNVAWILSDRTQPPSVRIEAAQTLGRFGALAKDQLPVLRDVMNTDPDEDVRNAASTAVLAVDRPLKE